MSTQNYDIKKTGRCKIILAILNQLFLGTEHMKMYECPPVDKIRKGQAKKRPSKA